MHREQNERSEKTGRNDLCPCGSGKKYKKCCLIARLASDLINPAWRKLRQTEGELIGGCLLPYVKKSFPKETLGMAWDDFLPEYEFPEEIYENLRENMFIPWLLFDWIEDSSHEPIALQYFEKYKHRLNDMQKRFIEAMGETYYSFYVVLDVIPEQSLKLKDILLQTEHIVSEFQGTLYLHRGDIIFTRILTLDGISLCIGMAPCIIPSDCHMELLDYRKELEEENRKTLTGELLRTEGLSLRFTYFDLLYQQINRPRPILHNTDGDLFEFCKIYFTLNIEPQKAFEKLLPLTLSNDPEEFLSSARKNREGKLKYLEFPWLKAGNKQHKEWENTVMGHIVIHGDKVIVETNSQTRAKKIQALMEKYLGDEITYQKTRVESVEKKLKHSKEPIQKNEDKKMDIIESPEMQVRLKEMSEKHWEHWINTPLPVLGGLTPKEAAKTKEGRERLEVLFLDFERKNEDGQNNIMSPDVNNLRKQLGLIIT
jgi:hypothetical protein